MPEEQLNNNEESKINPLEEIKELDIIKNEIIGGDDEIKVNEKEEKQHKIKYNLNVDQKQTILKAWEQSKDRPPSIQELLKIVFPDKEFDARSSQGHAIRLYLSTLNLKPTSGGAALIANKLAAENQLNDEQKQYIANNCAIAGPLEMTKVIFNKKEINGLSRECRLVIEYLKTISDKVKFSNGEDLNDANYNAPNSIVRMLNKIKKYVKTGNYPDEEKDLQLPQRKQIQNVIGYMHNYRFITQMNSYIKKDERELLESSFVSYVYDKDLSEEELLQYILLSVENVIMMNIQIHIATLERLMNNETDKEDDAKIRLSLVEAISDARKEYGESHKRLNNLISNLTIKRSNRLKETGQSTFSLATLFSFWRTEEKKKQMLHLANLRREAIKKEIDRLSDMDDLKIQVFGIDPQEVLDGM